MSNAKYRLHVLQKEPSKDEVFNAFLLGTPTVAEGIHNAPPGRWRSVHGLLVMGAALCWRPLLWTAAGAIAGTALGFAFARWL